MKLVVGLGNPGSQYERTRHNLGFMVADELARRHSIDVSQEKFRSWIGLGLIADYKVALAKPTTFMNRSGQAVQAIGRFYKLELEDLLVVTDDIALPFGKLRIRAGGSAGGHNGLADVIQRLGTEAFSRMRIGIDSPQCNATEHVLGKFDDSEWPAVVQAVSHAADAVTCWIKEDVEVTMNRYNQGSQQ